MLSDTMDAANDSFFLDAIPDEAAQNLANGCQDYSESHDMTSTDLPDTDTGFSKAIAKSRQTPDRSQEHNAPPQAMLVFVLGEHSFSDSCELGVLNEHPEALKTITSNQCLSTSAFLNPALHAVMAELRPSMMVQVAVRLTAISLRLVAEILPTQHVSTEDEGVGGDEQQKLSETVRYELEQAVPYYQWQGPRNYYGRVQYLTALLEEAIRVLAVPTESLTEALKVDEAATCASERVVREISDLGQSPADVCGVWAAETILSAWGLEKAYSKLSSDRGVALRSEKAVEAAGEDVEPRCRHEAGGDDTKIYKSLRCMTPDSESEDELPSPSTFIRSKPIAKKDNDVARPGSRAGRSD